MIPPDISEWRQFQRNVLVARRAGLSRAERITTRNSVVSTLLHKFAVLRHMKIGFYWPFKGEVNLRPFVVGSLGYGSIAALPVVIKRSEPLEFWRWTPEMPLKRGIWDIPVPDVREKIDPTVLLIPLVGFDEAGYRLGHGGGYYDRTLASLQERPLTIGIGYEFQRLPTIHPQPHDIPMDCIITEAGLFPRPDSQAGLMRNHPLGTHSRSKTLAT